MSYDGLYWFLGERVRNNTLERFREEATDGFEILFCQLDEMVDCEFWADGKIG